MGRTNENKLKMKDIATIGIFSALLFVVTMVAGALMGISMVLNMYSVAVVAVLSAPLYMLIMAKVHKKGAVLLTFAIVGILWGLFGGIFVLIWMLGFGVVGEVLASKSKYQNYKMLMECGGGCLPFARCAARIRFTQHTKCAFSYKENSCKV